MSRKKLFKKVTLLSLAAAMIFGTSVFATWTPKRSMPISGTYKIGESKNFEAENVQYNKNLMTQATILCNDSADSDSSFTWTFMVYRSDDNVRVSNVGSIVRHQHQSRVAYIEDANVETDIYLHTTLSRYSRFGYPISGTWDITMVDK